MKLPGLRKYFLLFLLSLTVAFSVRAAVLNETVKQHPPPVDLPQFVLDRTVILNQIRGNASGLTWDKEYNRLVAVVNNPPEIHFFTPHALPVQTVTLKNCADTEAVSHINGNLFGIVNERRMDMVLALIDSDTQTIDADYLPRIRIADAIDRNDGIEGLTYDPSTSSFFAVKEKSPKMIYKIHMEKWPGSFTEDAEMQYHVGPAWELPFFCYWLRDLSGIHYDDHTGHFLILSDDSKTIVEVAIDGKLLKRHALKGLLHADVPQPEGIVISPDRRLYILSEPNLLYIFNPISLQQT